MRKRRLVIPAAFLVGAFGAGLAGADVVAPEPAPVRPKIRMLEEPPRYGTYYQRYEPTFYTGFAPRAGEPQRVHLHVGRGNQLRITVVISDETLRGYARDLQARRDAYRALVDGGRIVLTQNRGLAGFEAELEEVGLDGLVAGEDELSPTELRERNVRLMERLNPRRVFRISLPADEVVRRWAARLRPEDREPMSRDRRLEVLNAMLPTRLWVAEMDGDMRAQLQALVRQAPAPDALGDELPPALETGFFALLERTAPGLYPRREGRIEFVEFTAIHPIGTFNDYADYRGRKIPLYPTPGRRALTTHQRTHTVDHIPTVAAYSYSPWIPYMHVGTKLHNSFHTLWWRMEVDQTAFLPESWRRASLEGRNGEPNRHLWLLSRGPMSSGCTHLTTGHISELRQLLPAETEQLYEVDVFLNRSYDYDVFDIDGDFEPEVMGVRYFIAYSLRNKRPNRLRVRNERGAYYDWLYAGELEIDAEGKGSFSEVHDGRFVERVARRGSRYERLPLHEAAYQPERIQFYRLVDIPFARELRKVGVNHPFAGALSARGAASP
jgi:hypothetical protein